MSLGIVIFVVLRWCVENLQCSKTIVPWLELESQTVSAFPAALHDPTSTNNACQSHFLLLSGWWFFFQAYWCKIVLQPLSHLLYILHYSSFLAFMCQKNKYYKQRLHNNSPEGPNLRLTTSCSTQISSPNRPTSCSCLSDCYATKGTFSTLKLFEMLFVCALSIWTWTWLAKNSLSGMFKYPLSPYKS